MSMTNKNIASSFFKLHSEPHALSPPVDGRQLRDTEKPYNFMIHHCTELSVFPIFYGSVFSILPLTSFSMQPLRYRGSCLWGPSPIPRRALHTPAAFKHTLYPHSICPWPYPMQGQVGLPQIQATVSKHFLMALVTPLAATRLILSTDRSARTSHLHDWMVRASAQESACCTCT